MLHFLKKYTSWLQYKVPTGLVENYPEINQNNETSLKNVFIIGDLTGLPLLKLASEGGAKIINQFIKNSEFNQKKDSKSDDIFDVIIVGAGPSGVAAALECKSQGLKYQLLEATKMFNTIENFPKGKLILAKPDNYPAKSQLIILDGQKESLLEDMKKQISDKKLAFVNDTMVKQISDRGNYLELETNQETKKALRVVLSIGKSGNARQLKVPGEDLPKVFNKLYDPNEFSNANILVVGGGDSALEATNALVASGNTVIHSYRKDNFARPKEENINAFNQSVKEKKIIPLFSSEVKKIEANSVTLKTKNGEQEFKNDAVLTLIGRELPLAFFKRSKIKMEGEKNYSYWVFLVAMISFFTMLYFGKSGFAVDISKNSQGFWNTSLNYLLAPFQAEQSWSLYNYAWYSSLNFWLGWLGSLTWIVSGIWSFLIVCKRNQHYFGSIWNKIKCSYFILVGLFFTGIYFSTILSQNKGWTEEPTYWYSFLYCTTMVIFSMRRVFVKKTRYIKWQMISLCTIQILFLFLLPFYLYEPFILNTLGENSWVIKEMFPDGKWSSFGFILFWPLNISNFGSSLFWTWFPFVQTFGLLFFLVSRYGKGVYCGWICSCGGMAESLGDEYRTKAPHGPKAKHWEMIGQVILVAAFIATALHFLSKLGYGNRIVADSIWGFYKLSIDVFFAGVLGLGVYFFLGGRVWCRYGCPLAAIMHIYTRFSKYRIVSNKKKCISCNTCTKVCHMGIDVMNFANKGIPMNDVECVRCSSCVQSCPTEVLAFSSEKINPLNTARPKESSYGNDNWKSAIK